MSEPWDIFPAPFIERLQQMLPAEKFTAVMTAFCQPRHTTLRANTLKISAEELHEQLTAAGIAVTTVPWWPNAFIVDDVNLKQVHHPLYVDGALYVQSLSSMLPPLILDPKPGEQVLDLTAAPGSKTTQMAALMQNQGQIIANDVSPVRLFKLQANLKQQGVTNTTTRRGPGEFFWRKFPEYFDKTLVDVPCSMEGRITCGDPESYEDWSYKKIKQLALRQSHLLRSAISATKPGGTIVYSTCTLAPEENEGVVDWILEKEHGRVVLEDINLPGVPLEPGVTKWGKHTYSPDLVKTARILPSARFEGFFVAKLRKIAPTTPGWE